MKNNKKWRLVMERVLSANDNTNVGDSSCSFPFDCKKWLKYKDIRCNADTCSNGYCYRMS